MTDAEVKLLTGEDLLKMSEDETTGYELIEGVLVKMPPTGFTHGQTEARIVIVMGNFNDQHKLGKIITGEVGFYTRGDNQTVRAVDVAFISHERMPPNAGDLAYLPIAPELVVEIVSPGNTANELDEKVQEWLDFGVLMVWVVYPKTRRVYVYESPDQAQILDADDTLTGGAILPGFGVTVSALFED